MIQSIKLTNFLSFGKDTEEVELLPLNIIIGANGCGKSNFLEAFDLLKNAPSSIVKPIREGGGDRKSLRTECRSGYNSFLQKAGLSGYMPRIVASGSRNAAYSDYCTAIKNGEDAVLLVDSESEVILPKDDPGIEVENSKTWKPWYHLVNRHGQTGEVADLWEKPADNE